MNDAVVSALDILPTLCDITGAKLPNKELDGESFSSLLKNGEFNRKKPLIWGFYNALNEHQVAMRHGDYKILARLENNGVYLPKLYNMYKGNEELIKSSELTDFELYNLRDDDREASNLATVDPAVFNQIKNLLLKEYQDLLNGSYIWHKESE